VSLLRYYQLIADLDLEIIPTPASEDLGAAGEVVADKDAHVLAGARLGKATHLITLDRRHFLRNKQREGILPIISCTPGEYLEAL
jgi:predicted nucleic acid-binding protein